MTPTSMGPTKNYAPSAVRRHRRKVHQLELENADLRRRLSSVVKDLEAANRALKGVAEWEAYIAQAAEEVLKRVRVATRKAAPVTTALLAEKRVAEEAKIQGGRATLYIADLMYSVERDR